MTDQPIKKSMNKPEAAGRMAQWSIELSQFDIKYHPRTAIKAQALADFIADFTFSDENNLTNEAERWTIQTECSSAQKRGRVGVFITTPNGEILKYRVQLKFPTTNNDDEYEGILTGLKLGKALGVKNLLVQNDSKLMIGQINKVEFVQVPRSQNMVADEISKLASSEEGGSNKGLAMEIQKHPSIEEVLTFIIQSVNSWMTPIVSFLQDGHLPQDIDEARKIKKRAARFTILNDALYKKGFSMPYFKCVDEDEAKYILEEIHKRICGDHAGPRSLVSKVIRIGYF